MKGLIFTYVVTYGGAAASLVNPYLGFLAYVCFGIIRPPSLWHWSVPPGPYSKIIAAGLLVGWLCHGAGRWNLGKAKWAGLGLIGFVVWAAVSAVFAARQDIAWDFVIRVGKIVLPVMVGVTLIDSVQRLKQLVWVIIVCQGYVALELNLSYLSGNNQIYYSGFATWDNNVTALTMVIGSGLALLVGFYATHWWQKFAALVACLLMAHAVMLSFSRGGILGLLVCGLTAFMLIPKKPAYYLAFAAALAVGFRMAGPEVVERFSTVFASREDRDESAQSRTDLWGACFDVMVHHPILGVGPDHWKRVAHQYGWNQGKAAHSLWMQSAAELGIPGLLCIFAAYGICVTQLWRVHRTKITEVPPDLKNMAGAITCALSGFAVSAMFVSVQYVEIPYYVLAAGLGVLKVATAQSAACTAHVDPRAEGELCTTGV